MTPLSAQRAAAATATFEKDGYVVARAVFSPSTTDPVGAYLASEATRAIARLTDELHVEKSENLLRAVDNAVAAPDFALRDKMVRDVITGHYPLDVRLSPELWQIPRDAALRDLLRSLLGSEKLYMHMPPTARFVLPRATHAAVPPHQDLIYNTHMSNFITVWVPLVKIDDECGGVAVYRGSGQAPPLEVNAGGAVWFDGVETRGYEKIPIHCDVGDVLVMNNHIIHTSMPNRSDRIRISIDCRFFGEDGRSAKHFLDMQTWRVIAPSEVGADGRV